MLISLFIALLSTFLWLNITIAEIVNSRTNPYANDNGVKNAKYKTCLSFVMALFWAIVIRYI